MLVDYPILTLIVFLPALGALLSYVAGSARAARWIALGFSLLVLALASVLLAGFLWPDAITLPKIVTPGAHTYYAVEKSPWVPTLNVNYFLGADELSVVLVFLNALLTPLAMAISWDEHTRVPEFFAMFLFMETTISGVFLSLDLFQFLVFWEVGLVPMYFLIAVWGGPAAVRRDQVLPIHLPRVPPAPRGRLRVLLLLESAHVRHDRDHRERAGDSRRGRGSRLRRPAHRLRDEAADVAVAHLAARRPRGGADRRFRDPRGRPPEARRIRAHPFQRPDAPDRGGRPVLAPRPRRHHLDPIRGPRLHRAGRSEAA